MNFKMKGLLPLALLLVACNILIYGAFSAFVTPFLGWLGVATNFVVFFGFTYIVLWFWKRYLGGNA